MPATYEPIATTTLSTTATAITFSSIPSTYTDLRLVWTVTPNTSVNAYISFNSTSGTDYSQTRLIGDGASATSNRQTADYDLLLTSPVALATDAISFYTFDIFSYAGSTNKTMLITWSNDKNGSGSVVRSVALWRKTDAINQINLTTGSSMKSGTTATLYGILKA